ncbi:helicase-related protein [Actinomycetospora soli]|uniref:helicase-related protein n=1 Tax=Actinomycetospora soli TaxID=2893887 RepID=UPI001E58B5AC|nr:helicase-related protein [Actinomycetospora soli]MCD2186620.1 DEAD/DEAH box helicase [Actinomycetospora soli]
MRLEELVTGVLVNGIAMSGPVTVVAVEWVGGNRLVLTYRPPGEGPARQQVLGRKDEERLAAATPAKRRHNADPAAWLLGTTALRLKHAPLDQMLAVSGGNLQPLPHQIRAVYDELLPRTPLRFLLADDPGAGKTIMCGLYIKELLLRGDLERCLVVAPGSLVEQWQDELFDKFQLRFELLTRSLVDGTLDGNVFDEHPLLIARMDQLSRNDDYLAALGATTWDLVVVDEAHRMSAQRFGGAVNATKRYHLGRLLESTARHFLLMTATPHAGKPEDFELFLALLDPDRFEPGHVRRSTRAEVDDLVRRMVKEDLLTMEGKPLFPERRAYTVEYQLSAEEQGLYEAVTDYVRHGMDRAQSLEAEGKAARGRTVGFALTVLQRRLASSPEAILRSLQRRRERLHKQLQEPVVRPGELGGKLDLLEADEVPGPEQERLEDEVVDLATAARSRQELAGEVAELDGIIRIAADVRRQDNDRKWQELKRILDQDASDRSGHQLSKLIVFTEHRDTLRYLVERVGDHIGDSSAVVSIHGGIPRDQRRTIQHEFTSNAQVKVLVATDAAGEGLNLQRAHLMVNYDLPWNPNRIEQRFGRIHRIGQAEVCHLWNLVASDTREGDVYLTLLQKLEQQRSVFSGKVFDVLGEAFRERPLRDMLLEAVRYGDQPEVRARLRETVDATVSEGLSQLLGERALLQETLDPAAVGEVRREMEKAEARRLRPADVRDFLLAGIRHAGGRASARRDGTCEVQRVPTDLRERARGRVRPARSYESVRFEPDSRDGSSAGDVVRPGHPLLDTLVDQVLDDTVAERRQGCLLVDDKDRGEARLLVALVQSVVDSHEPPVPVTRRFEVIELRQDGTVVDVGPQALRSYRPATSSEQEAAASLLDSSWLSDGLEEAARTWAITTALPAFEEEVSATVGHRVGRTRRAVVDRLAQQIEHWDHEADRLAETERSGGRTRMRPDSAARRARELEDRLARRLSDLTAQQQVVAEPPRLEATALVVPARLVAGRRG